MECTLRQALGSTSRWVERNKYGAQRREEVRAVLAPPSRKACGRTREGPAWRRIASRGRRGGFDPAIARAWLADARVLHCCKNKTYGGRGGVSEHMGPKCEIPRPPPKTLAGGSPNSSPGQWRAATRLRRRRWSAWRSSTPAPPASSLAFPSGPLGRLLKRRLAFSRWEGAASMRGTQCYLQSCVRGGELRRHAEALFRLQPDTLSPPPDGG
ncbi:uncharacterized protein Tco025E_09903 [Trypanosoma conorhini]|uniref:Uncharacterized protein n=1 Tax=Trypanosoma conorhini TaxID=83891 RepID=A0A3R7MV67_9TRYP|nr:uncharacterized protein Tco025E_09903 [Trypanosoma conorhini]RNE95832.1 hypothetical protein Tco025E_09903 [Trypanosoma conorhini]